VPLAIQRSDRLAFLLWVAFSGSALAEATVKAEIDLRDPALAFEQMQTLAGGLTAGDRTIDLDLTIIPSAGTPVDYLVTITDTSGTAMPFDCHNGFERLPVDDVTLDFATTGIYTHLLLSVSLPKGATAMLGCAAGGNSPDTPVLLLSGRFAVSILPIPTAYDVLLTALP
jgi:hypothetical protein